MMRAIPLDFDRAAGYAMPKDRALHKLAVQFAEKECVSIPNFSEFHKVWAICEMEDESILSVQGLLGFCFRPDFSLNRFLSPDAIVVGYERANAFLGDQGARGQEVTVYMSSTEAPEQKCPNGLKTILSLGARPADRWVLRVK
jgi:hypothetical protein